MTSEPEPKDNVVRLNVGGKDGKLTTSVGSHIPVRVYERSGDYLMLVLMLDAGDELSQDVVEPLLLEYVSPRGLVRFHGQAVDPGARPGAVRRVGRARGHPAARVRARARGPEGRGRQGT